jgi:tetratricopeptide (TPR) repeat protein
VAAVPIDAGETVREVLEAAKPTASSAALEQIRATLDRAARSLGEGKNDEALRTLEALAKTYPHLPPARLILARMLMRSQQHRTARLLLEQTARQLPAYPGTYVTFGDLALAEGRVADAMVHFEKARSLLADKRWERERRILEVGSLAGLAAVAAHREDWRSAVRYLSAWLKLDAKNVRARQQLARARLRLGDEKGAYQALEGAAADDPKLGPPAMTLGWMYADKGDRGKAAEWTRKAVEVAPDNAAVQRAYATWLLRDGKPAQATRHLERAEQLEPGSRETRMLRGLVARYDKDYALAERLFEALHRESPADSAINNQLAVVLAEQADKKKRHRALHLAETNTKLFPHSHEALATLGWVYYREGSLENAERVLQEAVAGGVRSPDVAYYLARVLLDLKRPEQARRFLAMALDSTGLFLYGVDAEALRKKLKER